ncbi:hypothetical protein B0H13DRAFT_1962429 [Mycena leptocephala]|nr:hypothetical protein B0H13DRAFT_1962429 [Mycena leptocephala]
MWHVWLSPEAPTPAYITSRLRPATTLTDAHIPCIVWGEEALRWIHGVPTLLFNTLHLLVPENRLQEASHTLSRLLPEYAAIDSHTDDPPWWIYAKGEKERFQQQGRLPYASPLTIKLSHKNWGSLPPTIIPEHILLTPDSFFHMSATNPKSLVSLPQWDGVPLPPSLYDLRFPALPVMYDTLLSMVNYLGYLHLYRFSDYVKGWYKEVKDLPDPIREVGLALRAENQPRFWNMWLRDEPFADDSDDSDDFD